MLTCVLLAIATLAGCSESSPSAPAAKVYVIPSSINANGSVDVTADINAWIKTVPDNSILQFAPGATYRVDGGLFVDDRRGLTFDGNGATFEVTTASNACDWTVRGGSDITFRNMTARGPNPNAGLAPAAYNGNYEWQHGFSFMGTQGATLDSVQAYDMYGDFVEAGPDQRVTFPGEPVRNLVVKNSHFERNGRMGIGLTHVDGFTLQDSYLGDVRWSAIDLELDDPRETGVNVKIVRNHFGHLQHSLFSNVGYPGTVGSVDIEDNVMDQFGNTCQPPIAVATARAPAYYSQYTVAHNTLKTFSTGVWMIRTKDVTLRNNSVVYVNHGCSKNSGVELQDAHTGTITGNTVTGAATFLVTDSLTTGIVQSQNTLN